MSLATGLSVEEFLDGDWPPGAQLVDGEVVMNDPAFRHQRVVARLIRALGAWTEGGPGRGEAGFGGNWTLAPGQSYKPDVWWAAAGHVPDPDAVRSDTPPDLVVEVRSPGTWHVDVGRKRSVYERAGVAELWLVDTPVRTVLVQRRSGPDAATFDLSAEVGPGGVLTSRMLEAWALGVDELFAD